MGSSSGGGSAPPFMIRRNGEPWHLPAQQVYDNEGKLKFLLRDSPQLLPTFTPGMVVVDELTVPSIGSVDLAAVSPNGNLTLIECKLSSNNEIRRSIIGQIFAYAAGLWQLTYEEFDWRFSARSGRVSLANWVKEKLPEDMKSDWREEDFRTAVAANLEAGRFALVVAVDQITDELKKVVPFINAHTNADVQFLALEVSYIRDGDIEIIQPSTYGQESVAQKRSTGQRVFWTQEEFFNRVLEYSSEVRQVVNSLVSFANAHHANLQGGSGAKPSLNVRFALSGRWVTVWTFYINAKGPTFDLNFDYLRDLYSTERLEECASIMRRIPGVADKYGALATDFRVRPSLQIDPILLQQGAVETIKMLIEGLLL